MSHDPAEFQLASETLAAPENGQPGSLRSGDWLGLMATAKKLLQIQELMRRIHGESYAARIAPWQRIIEAKAKHDGTSETAAAVALSKCSPNGPQALLILAAAVEMKSPNTKVSHAHPEKGQ